jgi:hypothetical protein
MICREASSAQNNIAAVSAESSTVGVPNIATVREHLLTRRISPSANC